MNTEDYIHDDISSHATAVHLQNMAKNGSHYSFIRSVRPSMVSAQVNGSGTCSNFNTAQAL